MRISTAGLHQAALTGIQDRNAALARTQSQIASGKRIQTPADDPAASVNALNLERALAELQQYARNSDVLEHRLALGEQAFAQATEVLQRIRELAIQANNATQDRISRQAIAVEVQVRLDELLAIANRRDANGAYLFSGYAEHTPPFLATATGVLYQGDEGIRELQIGPAQRLADGYPGSEVFMNIGGGGADMFSLIGELLTTLTSPTGTEAERTQFAAGIEAALTGLDQALDHLNGIRARTGARLSLIEQTKAGREDELVQLQTSISQLRDLDYVEAITRLNLEQLGLQAAQSSYARLAQLSLFDYMP